MKIKFFPNGVPDLSGIVQNQAILNKLRTSTPKIIFREKFGVQQLAVANISEANIIYTEALLLNISKANVLQHSNTGILKVIISGWKPEVVDLAACDPCARLLAGTSPAATICTKDVKKLLWIEIKPSILKK
jgi:hypothetical protein